LKLLTGFITVAVSILDSEETTGSDNLSCLIGSGIKVVISD